jgi:hypothetical protein
VLSRRTPVTVLRANGSVWLRKVTYMADSHRAGQDVIVVQDDTTISIADLDGTMLIEHTRATPGLTYVGNGRPRGRPPQKKQPHRHRCLETSQSPVPPVAVSTRFTVREPPARSGPSIGIGDGCRS